MAPTMTADTAVGISPGSPVVRATVIRVDVPRSGLAVGDWFEFRGSRLFIPQGTSLPPSLLAAVTPLVALRQTDLPADHWFARKPFLCGPDAEENLVVRIDAIPLADDTEGAGA
jgi:uncharacterized repeat protein (TIGR04076 family)